MGKFFDFLFGIPKEEPKKAVIDTFDDIELDISNELILQLEELDITEEPIDIQEEPKVKDFELSMDDVEMYKSMEITALYTNNDLKRLRN